MIQVPPVVLRFVVFAIIAMAGLARAAATSMPSLIEPAISPDGAEIAFASAGDIWTVPAKGGAARLLIAHPANDSHPVYSPDGKTIAFVSTRGGNGDIHLLDIESGNTTRLTFSDAAEQLDGWSADGKWIYFSTSGSDIGAGARDIQRIRSTGGTPMPVAHEQSVNEFFSAPHPDNQSIAYCSGGMADRSWWRKGNSHGDQCEIYRMNLSGKPAIEQLTPGKARDIWPMWSRDGNTLYYVSDITGAFNVHARDAQGRHTQLTHFKSGKLHFPAINRDGTAIVFERGNGLWVYDINAASANPVEITLRGSSAGPNIENHSFTSFDELALSPDGRKLAVVVHGEIFAASVRDGGDAVRITKTTGIESHITWSRDSRRLAYVASRNGVRNIFQFDFANDAETQLTTGADDTRPKYSPDGRSLAYQAAWNQIRSLDLVRKTEKVLVKNAGFDRAPFDRAATSFIFSPAGDWIAYSTAGRKGFDNVFVVPSEGGAEARQVTFLSNTGSNSISWAADGTTLYFGTGQRTEDYQLARVDLVLKTPRFREDQFRELFRLPFLPRLPGGKDETDAAENPMTRPARLPATTRAASTRPATIPATTTTAPVVAPQTRITFADIRSRLNLINLGFDVESHTLSPDGKTALIVGNLAGQQNLYTYSIDDAVRDAVPRQLTSTPGYKYSVQFSPDGKDVFYLDAGKVTVINLELRVPRVLNITAGMDVDFDLEKVAVFEQAWTLLRDQFADSVHNGADWENVRSLYAPHIRGCKTPEELRRLLQLMSGELDASHTGFFTNQTPRSTTGRLGVRLDRAAYDGAGLVRIAAVHPLSPAAVAQLSVLEYIRAVDGKPLDASTNLDELLALKVGKRVVLGVSKTPAGPQRQVIIQPTSSTTERNLAYRAWVESRRQFVDRISNGRLGYVHLADMTEAALARFYQDLDADNQTRAGVIIDVRNNRGGFVNGYAIDVLARKNYLTMIRRGFAPSPSRIRLGQRALDLPTALVVNRNTYSDGEDFTEAYRALKLGPILGESSAGAVIFTSQITLLDGTRMGLPHTAVVGNDGRTLEGNPRLVDVEVSRAMGESYDDKDLQLERSVAALLARLPSRPK